MIDNCKYSFRELAIEVLPEYMKKMREAIKRPYPMTRFAIKDEQFQKEFEEAKKLLRSLRVSFIEIENDLELYLFEAYCALELNTFKWNTFRTH